MTTVLAPGLARKVKKVLDTKTEAPEILSSLSTLSTLYGDNSLAERRQLRNTVEKQGRSINEEFLAAAETVTAALDVVQADLDSLSSCCGRITGALAASRAASAELLGETAKLGRSLESSLSRSLLVEQFLEQYQLSHDEVYALQEEEMGDAFFGALERVREIHANCRALLRTHHQRAGLELMDSMAAHQESAYERLCRWVQSECRGLGEQDAPEVEERLQRGARALRQRSVLFRYCAEEVATARHGALFQRFIAALTRAGPGGMPRPIEMHAHDPRRYIGDMLAWVHQALASERDLLVSLFGEESAEDGAPAERSSDMPSIASLLDRVFESICKPLKVRIEQVLISSPPLLLSFKLGQLLGFYRDTLSATLGEGAALVVTLQSCRAMAARCFQEQLQAAGAQLMRYPPPPPRDLSPPPQVAEGVHTLMEIIDSFESAYDGGASGTADAGGAEFAAVLSAAVEPLVDMCERGAEALNASAPSRVDEGRHLAPGARQIYLINCLAVMQAPLSRHACAEGRAAMLGQRIEGHVAALVGGAVGTTLAHTHIAEIMDRMRLYQDGRSGEGAVMAADPALSPTRIAEAMRAFFTALSQPDTLPEFQSLQVPRIKADASARVARGLADAYEALYHILTDPQHGYTSATEASEAIKHTPLHVRTILGVVT